jgi:hypothetical protein
MPIPIPSTKARNFIQLGEMDDGKKPSGQKFLSYQEQKFISCLQFPAENQHSRYSFQFNLFGKVRSGYVFKMSFIPACAIAYFGQFNSFVGIQAFKIFDDVIFRGFRCSEI